MKLFKISKKLIFAQFVFVHSRLLAAFIIAFTLSRSVLTNVYAGDNPKQPDSHKLALALSKYKKTNILGKVFYPNTNFRYKARNPNSKLLLISELALIDKNALGLTDADKALRKLKGLIGDNSKVKTQFLAELGTEAKILANIKNVIYGISSLDLFFIFKNGAIHPLSFVPGAYNDPLLLLRANTISPLKTSPADNKRNQFLSYKSSAPWHSFIIVEYVDLGAAFRIRKLVKVVTDLSSEAETTAKLVEASSFKNSQNCIEDSKFSSNPIQSDLRVLCDCCLITKTADPVSHVCDLNLITTNNINDCAQRCDRLASNKTLYSGSAVRGFHCDLNDPNYPGSLRVPLAEEYFIPKFCQSCQETAFSAQYSIFPNPKNPNILICAAQGVRSCQGDNIIDNSINSKVLAAKPTATKTPRVTATKTRTPKPTATRTKIPTPTSLPPTAVPTPAPTMTPTVVPTTIPTIAPTTVPTTQPTTEPTTAPTISPTAEQTPTPNGTAVTFKILDLAGYLVKPAQPDDIPLHVSNDLNFTGKAALVNRTDAPCNIKVSATNAILSGGDCTGTSSCPFSLQRLTDYDPKKESKIWISATAVCYANFPNIIQNSESLGLKVNMLAPKLFFDQSSISNYGIKTVEVNATVTEGLNRPQEDQYEAFYAKWFPKEIKAKDGNADGSPKEDSVVNEKGQLIKLKGVLAEDADNPRLKFYVTDSWYYGSLKEGGDPYTQNIKQENYHKYKIKTKVNFVEPLAPAEDPEERTVSPKTPDLYGRSKAKLDWDAVQSWSIRAIKKVSRESDTTRFCYGPNPAAKITGLATCELTYPEEIGQYWEKVKKEEDFHCRQFGGNNNEAPNWDQGGIGNTLTWPRIKELLPAQQRCDSNVILAMDKAASDIADAVLILWSKFAVTHEQGCWQEYTAKKNVELTSKVGAWHYEVAYPNCYGRPTDFNNGDPAPPIP